MAKTLVYLKLITRCTIQLATNFLHNVVGYERMGCYYLTVRRSILRTWVKPPKKKKVLFWKNNNTEEEISATKLYNQKKRKKRTRT